ncbi:dystrobrevin binding protein dysbindin [Lycorma delicatula]|uniref:dystrobrevin binding protein dysbindin n=1 Tax=Lycorma delicatula TaxID=130591 RepID=UPI003F517F99
MFYSLKDKLHTVQEGITASFRGLAAHSPVQGHNNARSININSGADILHHYQIQWNELHKLAEENSSKAQEVDNYIGNVHKKVENEWINMGILCNNLSRVPQMTKDMEKLISDIGSLHKLIDDVESMLINLEDTIEMQKLQESQLEKRFKLAMHHEKKLCELDTVRSALSSDHMMKLNHHENKVREMQKERQATFSDAFKNDLEQYKKHGAIPAKEMTGKTTDHSLTLDEVELDFDNEALNEFVNG